MKTSEKIKVFPKLFFAVSQLGWLCFSTVHDILSLSALANSLPSREMYFHYWMITHQHTHGCAKYTLAWPWSIIIARVACGSWLLKDVFALPRRTLTPSRSLAIGDTNQQLIFALHPTSIRKTHYKAHLKWNERRRGDDSNSFCSFRSFVHRRNADWLARTSACLPRKHSTARFCLINVSGVEQHKRRSPKLIKADFFLLLEMCVRAFWASGLYQNENICIWLRVYQTSWWELRDSRQTLLRWSMMARLYCINKLFQRKRLANEI